MAENRRALAFLGLGSMGFPMARNLANAGFQLRVWNRTVEKARERLKELPGAKLCETPREAAQSSEFVVTSLANDDAVRQVTFGDEGLLAGLEPGAIHLGTSTISLRLSRELDQAHAKVGGTYIASPVFGRPEAAEKRQLWIAAGGPSEALDQIKPILEALGRGHSRFPSAPQATLMKLCGNLLIASIIEMLGEALALGEKGGIRPDDAMDVINAVFGSQIMTGYGTRIAHGTFKPAGFKASLGFKDVKLALESGEDLKVPLPFASIIRDHLVSVLARGGEALDWASLATVVREEAGLPAQGLR